MNKKIILFLASLLFLVFIGCDDVGDNDTILQSSDEYEALETKASVNITPNPINLIYYNSLDNDPVVITGTSNQFKWTNDPITGYMVESHKGGYNGWDIVSMYYNNGLHVWHNGRKKSEYQKITLFPFSSFEKGDIGHTFGRGTVAYLARTIGGWRGKGDDTYIDSHIYFYLTENIYVHLRGKAKKDYTLVNFYYRGTLTTVTTIPNRSNFAHIVLQWDLDNADYNARFIKLIVDGTEVNNQLPAQPENDRLECASYLQKFFIKIHTDNGGDYRPSTKADLDHIQIYDEVTAPNDLNIFN